MLVQLPDPELLAPRILRNERAAIARGLNLLDNALPEARALAMRLLAALATLARERWLTASHLIGITGPPGAGKSSLVAALIREWRNAGKTVAVLAVDPSSRPELGGGALLGDRIRIKSSGDRNAADEGLFIRSLASRNQLGGVATEVWPMSLLLLGCFDIVVVETVGVGQTELDIADISDTVCYVAQPASGDTIQYLKSGIMEIPDVFAVNKADLGGAAHKTAAEIGRSGMSRNLGPDRTAGWDYPVCLVSAATHTGITQLAEHLARHREFLVADGRLAVQRRRHQSGWGLRLLQAEFGSFGIACAGGHQTIAQRLTDALEPLHEYAQMRQHLLDRFQT